MRVGFIRDRYTRFRVRIHEAAKFSLVGFTATLITLGGANALHLGAGWGPLWSVTVATIVATVLSFTGNKLWAFRHRQGSHLRRESALFFLFNGIGLIIQLAFVAAARYGLGLTDTLSYNLANLVGVLAGTVFRLYSYRRWVFTALAVEPDPAGRLEPETLGGC
jgi:putative flippase GtrA